MKRIAWLFLAFLAGNRIQAQQPGARIDVQHYTFGLTLNDANNSIQGKAGIEILALQPSTSVVFELTAKKPDGKGMTVLQVKSGEQTVTFRQSADSIHIDIPLKTGDRKSIEITYEGIPSDGLIIDNNKYKNRGFFADNWPNRAHHWLPCIDHPSDKAPVDFIVTAPNHYQVVANGIQVEETSLANNLKLTHYKETTPLPMKVMVIGVADFAVQYAGDVQCIPVYSWVYPENKDKGFYDYAQATEILPYFIRNVGPYGYKKLANVQSKTMFGGLENAGAIFYSEGSVTGTRRSESLLTHEIAHQWFGDMATETEWAHIWLSEGFATYMTILYFENKYGQDTARKMLLEDRSQVIAYTKRVQKSIVDTSVRNYMDLLNPNSYQKGGWVLHMLRGELGDTIFWKGIRNYYARYSGKNASTDDLRKCMEEVSGKDLRQFFKQWLLTPGHPIIEITYEPNKEKKAVALTIQQKQDVVFAFPIELAFYGPGHRYLFNKTIRVSKQLETLNIPVEGQVSEIIADPGCRLLFEGSVKAR
ncbi:M1 family metallopeptidase [Paraflavitalea sp. CAU 1676]|uniref:M1 family metallopeptidase n=1 Tax=Paraflavitalea sp. CAU 1676 TaxID=3032598 RepID=UPI0023DA9736|nr:M1 family metallopeptidase [Paraflavitalea sp. CAU 1676]MDF2187465.1 M1 family metallopeptidase [Paraflavitalea sp. CAU 1676]